jgi:glutathione synthase/RimK-type ligase-like ATP-grasp enzyme
MNILIHTIPADAHAAAVQIALSEKNVKSQTWYLGDLPSSQKLSTRLPCDKKSSFSIIDEIGGQHINEEFDVVWHRRVGELQPVSPCIQEVDRLFVQREVKRFTSAAITAIGLDAFWVNGVAQSKYADDKILQLEIAKRVGLKIPETLASNSLHEVQAFFKELNEQKVIYKPFRAYSWRYSDHQLVCYTRIISVDDLPNEQSMSACPGIFQAYIEKAFELRVTVMGNHVTAAALYAKDKEDWRMSTETKELEAKEFKLPEKIENQCLELMKKLDLVFGCIDLIVTPEGDYVFLEVNEMGQFLWVEFMLPQYRLLDAFTDFLISKDPKFTWDPKNSRISYESVAQTEKFRNLMASARAHISPSEMQVSTSK